MKKILFSLIIISELLLFKPELVSADVSIVSPSAYTINQKAKSESSDTRVIYLKRYLEKHNSPLASYAERFIFCADEYNLDWRLVPAIAGVESTFGKRIPYGSFNAYGWANGKYYFDSWEDSIEIVSETLREKYYNRGATNIKRVAVRYAPPSSTWAWKVKFFMSEIDKIPVKFTL